MSRDTRKIITIVATILVVLGGLFLYRTVATDSRAGIDNINFSAIKFTHTDENEGEDLIITSDKEIYQGFSGATVYFNIDPLLKEKENIAMQFYFTDPKAKVLQIYQRKDNAWWSLSLNQGEVTDSTSSPQADTKFSKSLTRRKEIEGKIHTQSHTSFDSIGEKEYFMAEISYPPGTPGQFLIEAFGSSGSYGILDPWYDSGWDYRKKITINPEKVAGGNTNFPMLFSRTDPDLRDTTGGGHVASSTGGDILFTDENQNKIPHEIEYYASTTGQLIAWVNVPFVSSTSTRDIYIYYGNDTVPLANQENKTGTWDTNFKGVWHLPNGTTLTALDSTSNASNGTLTNTPTATTGQIDGGANTTSASSQYISIGNISSLNVGAIDFTASYWIKPADANQSASVFSKRNNNNPFTQWQTGVGSFDSALNPVSGKTIYFMGYNGTSQNYKTTSDVANGNWHHIEVTRTSGTIAIYIDGSSAALTAVNANTTSLDFTNSNNANISFDNGTRYYNGPVDEVRFSATARSADWILTEYNNQSATSTFYSYSGEGVEIRSSSVAGVKIRGGPSPASNWYASSGWDYRKKITINPQYVAGGNTNFPMLFSRTDPDLRDTTGGGHVASSTGGDILFTSSDGATKIPHEIEYYASTTGQLIAWVNVPFVSSTSTRDIYIYYGNDTIPLANQENKTGTWDANYKGVWHLPNGTTLTTLDSTSNALNGTNNGTTVTAGQIDGGANFANVNQYIATGANTLGANNVTMEVWAYSTNFAQDGMLIEKETVNAQWELFFEGVSLKLRGGGVSSTLSTPAPSNNAWHHLVGVITGTTGSIYVDGVQVTNGTANAFTDTSSTLQIGRFNNGYFFTGKMDEVRVSNVERSADWILTEYNNQNAPNTFYSYSGEGVESQSASTSTVKIRGGVKFR